MSRTLKSLWGKTLDEIDKAEALVSVWLFLKDGKIAGRITVRNTKTRDHYYLAHAAFIMYPAHDYGEHIYGTEKVKDLGFDITNTAIADVFNDCRKKLFDAYGIVLDRQEWNVMNTWMQSFKDAGYSVMQAL